MPEFRVKETGNIITDLQREFPNVSLPTSISADDLEALGVDPILEGPQPTLTRFQSAVRTGPEQDSKGNWMWVYNAVDWSEEQIATATESQWALIRQQRNSMLTASDWTQLADAPFTEAKKVEWSEYRQELRDITTQTDPFDIQWPEQPK